MLRNKYLEIYDDIFPGNSDNNELKINKSYDLKWITCGAYDYTTDINLTKESIINLIDAEYVIFPTNKFFHYNLFGNGLTYFIKTKIVCINYYLRYILMQKLNIINEIIKSENKKYSKIKSNMIKLLKKEHLKPIYFLENEILPDTLYRKITFSQEDIFMSFNTYAFKRIEYKLKTLCQLVEKMGATKIEIKYYLNSESQTDIEMGITGVNNDLNGKIKNDSLNKKEFNIIQDFNEYNQINNINLNIYDLEKIIEKENEFYISKEQFETDIDIKFLLNARCVNLVETYNTKLVFEYMNKFERQIVAKANKFGLNLNFSFNEDAKEELYINVNFLDPFKYLDCINGYNISPYPSGFNHLSKLIKKIELLYHNNDKTKLYENIISSINCNKEETELYLMVNYFLESQLKLFNEKKNLLDLIYNTNINLIKAYNHIINTNFTSEQIQSLFYYFFRDNLSYKSFEKFRNILIKPLNNIFEFFVKSNYFNVKIINKNKYNFYDNILNSYNKVESINENNKVESINNKMDSINNNKLDECSKLINIEKIVFISYQYHNILDYRLKIMDMLEEGLERIKIKLIKTCDILKNIIYKESEEWEYIFKAINKINNGKKNKIYKLKKKFNIDYSDLYQNSLCFKLNSESDINGIDIRKYYEQCKKEYDKIQKIEESINDKTCWSYFNCKKNSIDYNKKDIQELIKNYMSKSLLDISNLIKTKIIKKISINISDLIPDKKKFLNKKNESTQNILNNNIIEPKLYISLNRINKNIINTDDFILQMLCFLMESYHDDINKKYDLKENFNKIQSDIKYNFELISSEIKNIFDKFFYKENGFFSKDEYDNITLQNELISLYTNNKVSDIDERVILVFSLLFESNYLNFSKISSSQSVFNNIYNLLSDIIKNYENHKIIPEATNIQYIKANFPLSKLILTYQRYKIFFTYEDFSTYFYTSYNNETINHSNYSLVSNFELKLNKINYTTFNKIYEIFNSKDNNDEKYKNLELELQNKSINCITIQYFIDIYKNYNINPRIHNYLDKLLCNHKYNINKKIIYLKNLTEEIEKNTLFIQFKNIILNKNDKKYFENLLCYFNFKNINLSLGKTNLSLEGINLIDEILQKNPEYINRLTELIYNLIMDKFNIKYNDLNNEDYNEYINKIQNEILPNISKNFYLKSEDEQNDNLFINKLLIEDSSDEDSSNNSPKKNIIIL